MVLDQTRSGQYPPPCRREFRSVDKQTRRVVPRLLQPGSGTHMQHPGTETVRNSPGEQRGSPGFETGDRHPERRARHIVETDSIEEMDRLWIATVFATHSEMNVGACSAATDASDPNQLANAIDINGLERRDLEHALLEVGGEESRLHVVAGESPGGLG